MLDNVSHKRIRVFVSSTFRDMQPERNFLGRYCFPVARRKFAQIGYGFTEIDLRWGLPVDESEERIVELCMQEVERCRGYFLSILGNRYGYIPQSASILQRYENREMACDASITELEVLRGAFCEPPPRFARFYFRRDGTSEDDPRLAALKARIVARGFQVRWYGTPEQLCSAMLKDLSELAESLAADAHGRTPVADVSKLYLQDQCRGVLPRASVLRDLDEFLLSDESKLCVVGPTGSGKTTVLAQWVALRSDESAEERCAWWRSLLLPIRRFGALHRRKPTLWLHYAASIATSSGGLRRLLEGLANQLSAATRDEPSHARALRDVLLEFHRLVVAASRSYRRIVLIIDGIDDLSLDPVLPFHWLPPQLSNLKVILSARTGGAEKLLPNTWQRLEVEELTETERSDTLTRYLRDFGKSISAATANDIAKAETVAQPLFLRTLADELRLAETPEHLTAIAHTLLRATSPHELFGVVLERLENEVGQELVASMCGMLACSRGGLEESELRALIRPHEDMSGVQWAGIVHRFSRSAVDRDGRYGLYDDVLREVIWTKYLPSADVEADFRRRLITWFRAEAASSPVPSSRVVEELPWQLATVGAWSDLEALLTDAAFFAVIWRLDPNQTIEYWRNIEAARGVRAPAALARMVVEEAGSPQLLINAALILAQLGHLDVAIDMAHAMRRQSWTGFPTPLVVGNLLNLAGFLQQAERHDDAGQILVDLRPAVSAAGSRSLEIAFEGALANWQLEDGDYDAALKAYREVERLCGERNDEYSQNVVRHNQALALLAQGDHSGAKQLFEDCAKYFRAIHDVEALSDTLLGSVTVEERAGKLKAALGSVLEVEGIARSRKDPSRLSRALNARARLLELLDDRDGAEAAQVERGQLCQDHQDPEGQIDALLARATIRLNLGPVGHNSALRLLSEAKALAGGEAFGALRTRVDGLRERLERQSVASARRCIVDRGAWADESGR